MRKALELIDHTVAAVLAFGGLPVPAPLNFVWSPAMGMAPADKRLDFKRRIARLANT